MELKTAVDKTSYALGLNLAQSLQQYPFELNREALVEGFKNLVIGENIAIPQEEYMQIMQELQTKMKELQQKEHEAMGKAAEANKKEAAEFAAKNKEVEGVVETESGLQYIVLTEGKGDVKPTKTDTVRVHYTGTLLDGTVFDSSVERGQPAEFGVGQVIPGWTEALQLMNVGSKYKLFIPSELAYGDRGAGPKIGPGAMLTFEVELLDIL